MFYTHIWIRFLSLSLSFFSAPLTFREKGRKKKGEKKKEGRVKEEKRNAWLRYSESRHRALNYTRVKTGFTSGDDSGLRCFFFSIHFGSTSRLSLFLSFFLTHSLVFSTRFSLRSLSDYRSGIIDKSPLSSQNRNNQSNLLRVLVSCTCFSYVGVDARVC